MIQHLFLHLLTADPTTDPTTDLISNPTSNPRSDPTSYPTSDSDIIIFRICHLLAAEMQAPPSHCHWSAAHTADMIIMTIIMTIMMKIMMTIMMTIMMMMRKSDEDVEPLILISMRMRE